MINSRVVFT